MLRRSTIVARKVTNARVNSKHRIGERNACIRLQREERDRDYETHGGHHRPGHHVRLEHPAQIELGTKATSYSFTQLTMSVSRLEEDNLQFCMSSARAERAEHKRHGDGDQEEQNDVRGKRAPEICAAGERDD